MLFHFILPCFRKQQFEPHVVQCLTTNFAAEDHDAGGRETSSRGFEDIDLLEFGL